MNLIHVVPQIDYTWGGLAYSIPRLCRELESLGNDVQLACTSEMKVPLPFPFVRRFGTRETAGYRHVGSSPGLRDWLVAHAKSGLVDIVHAHSMWRMPSVYPGDVARKYGVPLVVAPRGTLAMAAFRSGSKIKRAFWPLFQRRALQSASCFHATAASEADQVRQHGFTQPIALIPNGVDIPKIVPDMPKVPCTAIYLGRVHPIKNLDNLLRAWVAVERERPEWRLRIVGPDDGGHVDGLRTLMRDLGLQRVDFDGPLGGAAKVRAYAQASLFVMPTKSENFGLTVAEALAAGTPAVVSKGAPWAGVIEANCGWWVDPTPDALAAAMLDATSRGHEPLRQMGLRGRAWVAREFSWWAVAGRVSELYEWILRGMPESGRPEWVQPGTAPLRSRRLRRLPELGS